MLKQQQNKKTTRAATKHVQKRPSIKSLKRKSIKPNHIQSRLQSSTNSTSESTTDEQKSKKTKPLTLADFPQCGGPNSLFKQSLYYVSKSIFSHHGFNEDECKKVQVAHHQPKTFTDRWAKNFLRLVRGTFDLFTGYSHPPENDKLNPKYKMTKKQWMTRFIFLETVASVPGLAGAAIRHLQSVRLLRRDNGWIETLLEESYNERMHLLSFLECHQPGAFMKLMILGAQGIFFNAFFISYLISPQTCHRFVGYLEEEAVVTYRRCLTEMENGFYPEWSQEPAPAIARSYWKMPENATFQQMLYYIMADEATHREVNHTFANLVQHADPNPYSMPYNNTPHPSTVGLQSQLSHPVGWERSEIEVDAAMNPTSGKIIKH